ncbi:hypothetical protein [Dietzia lutea]|uniref:TetR family transcriptional regulator n=1 Tax=Dietzia lutea TaxID=546160 RepID=A0A2S1R3P8_9ACTN|nr:hypothetical protein [Dietzia lutea]AWH90920.1 hypothetical protein A6035_00575 [Dietzia lutea]
MHRYFPERADLIHAVVHHVTELSRHAIQRAEPHSGTVRDALRRVVKGHMDLGSILTYIYSEPLTETEPALAEALKTMEQAIEDVLARPATRSSTPS